MKKADWVIASSFILFGLLCLAMSMSLVDHSEPVHAFLMKAANYCLWVGLPLLIIGLIYLWYRDGKRKNH